MISPAGIIKNRSLTGILLLMAGGFVFSIQDVIIKYISGGYPVHEIVFFRSLFAVLPVFAIVRLEGGVHLLRVKSVPFHIVRGVLMFLCYTSYYLSIAVVPLSHTVTLFFCCPLFITVLSVIFLKEKMDLRGWSALIAGFIGIVVVVRPDVSSVHAATGVVEQDLSMMAYGSALALISGIFYAINAVCTRKYGINESGASLVFYPMLIYLLFSGIVWCIIGDGRFANDDNRNMEFLLRNWSVPESRDFLLIFVVGCVASIGTYCLSQAYRISEATVVAPFEFFVIPTSVGWGYLFWREIPDPIQWVGIIMIISSGVYVLKRHA